MTRSDRGNRPRPWRRLRNASWRAQLLSWIGVLLVLVVVLAIEAGTRGENAGNGARPSPTPGAPTPAPSSSSTTSTGPSSTLAPSSSTTTTATTLASESGPGSCHARGSGSTVLPDPNCTPGAVNSAVTQANIASTICRSGWTSTVRPPESYTNELKVEQMAAYGEPGTTGGYEEDHLVPLELGGSPTSTLNLWPEPGASPNEKDGVENAAHHAVCGGRMSLAAAQQAIATNWITFGQRLGLAISTSPTTSPPAISPTTSVPAASYRAGQFCPETMVGRTVNTATGPLTCEARADPSHPRWVHS